MEARPMTNLNGIEYHDMTPEQQRIADTAENGLIGGLEMPMGLTKSEMLVWMRANVARKPADLDHVRLTDGRVGLILGVWANGAAFEVESLGIPYRSRLRPSRSLTWLIYKVSPSA
jgi:hypothetical protein